MDRQSAGSQGRVSAQGCERFFSLRVRIGLPIEADLEDALHHFVTTEARARGIAPRRFVPIQAKDELDLVVIGPRDESQGFDADGAPTCEWPRPSHPWVSGVEVSP